MTAPSALVLTAGQGTRLDPLTRLVAKAAVPIAGRTLIERILVWLRRERIRDVVINLHHRPETITAVVGDGAHLGLRVRYSWEPTLLGSAGGPRHALPLMTSDPILIVNGDTLSDFALGPMLDRHEATRAAVTLAVVPNPAPDAYNGILVDTDDVVTGFVLKGLAARNWHFIGIQVARTAVYARLPDGVPADTIPTLYRSMLTDASGQVRAWRPTTDFVDVGTPRDYLEAALQTAAVEATGRPSDWHPESRESVVEAGARIDPSAVLERTVVWPEVEIGAGVVLENSIVAGPVRLPAGFRAEECVIVPAAAATPSDGVEVRDGAALFPL